MKLESLHCPVCGIEFGLPERLRAIWRDTSRSFFCPNGHALFSSPPCNPESVEAMKNSAAMLGREVAELKGALVDARQRNEQLEAKLGEGR